MIDKKTPKIVGYWLLLGCLMIYIMVIIGGITRLTGSGLSMVEWKVIGGSVPPISDADWQEKFELYKQFPQFEKVNYNMTVDDFKSIFWWEYIHRMWGRLIGIAFIVPFCIFLIKKWIPKKLLPKLLLILILGGFQGILGWIMVKSGLENQPWVSPYKLTAHLLLALFVFSYTFWTAIEVLVPERRQKNLFIYKAILVLISLISIQLFFGGLMSGLKAAVHYPTFPTMNGQWFPEQLFLLDSWWENLFENIAMVQFIHRNIGYLIFGVTIMLWIKTRNSKYRSINVLLGIVLLQVVLGITTLVLSKGEIPVLWGVLHQAGAVLVLTASLFVFYSFSKK